MGSSTIGGFLHSLCFEYDTVKVVRIETKYAGILSRMVQISIIAYVIGYVLVYQKGYQKFDNVQSSINTKVKGVLFTNYSDDEFASYVIHHNYKHLYNRIWDVNDYVVPAKENGGFFVITNVLITPNQTQSTCKELDSVPGAKCQSDRDCPPGRNLGPKGHGILTGKCEDSICVINAWCPVENDLITPLKNSKALLQDSKNLTVLIKNLIQFPYYKLHRTNILLNTSTSYLNSCLYNEETDPYCPIFKLEYIVNKTGYKYEDISLSGCSISIGINWDCDLDKDFMSNCRPKYSFHRLDNPFTKIAPGWNYRYSNYYSDNRRTLHKIFGINFRVEVTGRAGQFNIIPTFLNVGAGLATLGITSVICDAFILYVSKNKHFYRIKKFLTVKRSNGMLQDLYDSYDSDDNLDERSVIIAQE